MRVIVLVALCACSYSPVAGVPDGTTDATGDAGNDTNDPARVRIVTFANTASATELVNVPVLVPIGPTDIDHAVVTDPATQLRFHDPDTATDLPFEIDQWDAAGESLVWVRVPAIDAGSATDTIELHFGPDAAGIANGSQVWAGYDLVHHLDDTLTDSTGNGHTGTKLDVTSTAGQVGRAQRFAGGGAQRITFANSGALFDGWAAFTLELWLRLDDTTIGAVVDDSGVINKGGPMSLGRVFTPNGSTVVFQTDFKFIDPNTGNNDAFENTAIDLQTFTYLAYTFDGQALKMYEDGAQVRDEAHSTVLIDGNNPVILGTPGSNAARMTIDEVRVSQTPRDLDWLRAQHLSMTRQFASLSLP